MNLRDALFNWLQMHIVVEGRPNDGAALDTLSFFATILKEDYDQHSWSVAVEEDDYIILSEGNAGQVEHKFDRELADQLLRDIQSNPKYN